MANNVNSEEMRFVIRNLVDVDDVSPAMAQESTSMGDYLDVILLGNGARNSFPKEEGMMQHNGGRYFPQI